MEISNLLNLALENEVKENKISNLKEISENLSEKYRTISGKGKRLVITSTEALVYAITRMPATYGTVKSALENSLELMENEKLESLIDVGAGTGAATWAVNELLELKGIICFEREEVMQKVGKKLMQEATGSLKNSKWIKKDLVVEEIQQKADLVVASYVLNEMSEENRIEVARKMWKATEKLLLIVEPGTPVGYENLKKVRKVLLEEGANLLAPCSHSNDCKLEENDWCNFSCRIQRTKLHKLLKSGDVPYEDEKYFYLAFTRKRYLNSERRVLRHPIINSGYITLKVCTNEGTKEIKVTKRDGELFKKARKIKCGENL